MSSVINNTAELEGLLGRLEAEGVDRQQLEGPLQAALTVGSITPLAEWARKRGGRHAYAGHAVRDAVGEVLPVAKALEGLLGKDDTALLSLVDAAVSGYLAGRGDAPTIQDESLRDRLAELTALHRINSAANSSLKLDELLNETVRAVVDVTRVDICSIFLYEQEWDQLVLTATSGLNEGAVGKVRLQLGEGITGWAALLGKPVAVRNSWSDPRFKYVPLLQEERAVSILAVPVVLFTKEQLVGVITAHTYEERDFSDTETKFLETVAGEIAIAIENARLYEQTDARLRQKVAELSTLQGVSAHIAATLNLPEVLALIAHQAAHLVHADAATIYELHPDAGVLEMVAQYNLRDPNHSIHDTKAGPHVVLEADSSQIAHAVMRGIPTALPASADADLGLPFATEQFQSMFCVPLIAPRGIMGGICLYTLEDRTFSDEQVRLVDAFAHEAAIALENSRLYDAAIRGLQTKSAMLQEMNHRVRNNLQTVAGLLSMQMRRVDQQGEAATAMRESIARIQSIAAVHDLMMRGDPDVGSISIYDLAHKITDAAVSTLNKPGFNLKITIEPDPPEPIRVNSQEATLLALLFNELVSNTILHGFAGLNSGEIRIGAWLDRQTPNGSRQTRPTRVRVEVADNGRGIPAGFDAAKDASLGLNIVRTLVVSDLRGEFSIRPRAEGGTVATFVFRPSRAE